MAKALYSIPENLIGARVDVRADRSLVRVYFRGQLVKTHPRLPPGGRSTDAEDLPAEKTVYAMRDLDRLGAMAASHGAAIGSYAKVLLDSPLPWTKMRQVYALLGLVKKWGPERVEAACARAADAEAFDVGLIGRMLERATEGGVAEVPIGGRLISPRFARPAASFAVRDQDRPQPTAAPRPTAAPGPDRASPTTAADGGGHQSADQGEGGAA